ncbi:hypothetical protein SUGI_0792360 [Cryptomeria japonica]|nr:hypothetical protein SUGI_0792360 [Cryptomeria japonica]
MASTSTSGRGEQEPDPFFVLEPPNKRIKSALSTDQYDVFINHRGPDVKETLARQLYDSLHQAKIRAYLDPPQTELGDFFPSAIRNAIFSAGVHIAIFSPRYVESAWCLAELALMFQTKARIIPLFYNVNPSDFRYIKNRVADTFSIHEGRYPSHDIEQWKECLQNVSGIKGYEFNGQNDDADLLCKSILSVVKKEVENPKLGLDEFVEDFEKHCQQERGLKDNIIGIYGMGGSGKTTLANELFNRKRSKYVRSCSLFGVREASVNGDLTSLQTKLLDDLFYQNFRKISSTEEGIRYIKRCLGRKPSLRFLLVIDDVDQKSQLDALLSIDTLNSNSLVIITTRDERILIEAGIRVRYKVKGMDQQYSRQLFCRHAFHKTDHEDGDKDLVECFVKECGGLPLSLQALGEHVSDSSKKGWKSELAEYRKRLPDKIKNRLKISYDSLEEEVKQIFMDIACFFTEKDQTIATRIWKASGWNVEHALQILRDKCLVEVIKQDCWNEITDEESAAFVFKMHNHLRDLGREMADAGKILDPEYEALTTFKAIFEQAQEQRHRCFNSINDESISDKSITYFIGNLEKSTNLQWLELNGSESIPSWIPLEKLEGLRIRGRLPRKLWDGPQGPPLQLKELVCKFTNCGWMEKAMLRRNWKEISNSLGMLSRLESLVLQLESQENRKDIMIEWDSFVDCVETLNCLKTLGLSGLYINGEIAYPSKETTDSKLSLESLTLSHIGHTSKVSISGPSLKSLKLKQMEDLIEVNLSGLETLRCLELIQCDRLTEVRADDLPKLEMLSVERCWEIEKLPNLSNSQWLERTKITCCEELENIIGIEELSLVENITITCCPKLHSITGLECLKGLKYMILSDGAILSCVSELQELPSEFTVVMGKAAPSFPKAAEMARIIGALDDFQEISSESTAVTGRARPKVLSSESTTVTGRAVTSFLSTVKMTDIASSSTVTEESSESTFRRSIHWAPVIIRENATVAKCSHLMRYG